MGVKSSKNILFMAFFTTERFVILFDISRPKNMRINFKYMPEFKYPNLWILESF